MDQKKPIVRGEGGVARSGTQPQHPLLSADASGGSYEHKIVFYHKKLWAHVGSLGYTCDGEWYPRLFIPSNESENADIWKVYRAYERLLQGEPLSNGNYENVGTDMQGDSQILVSGSGAESLRAWGVRDVLAGEVLLWIDNANHTWVQVTNGNNIAAISGSLIVQGLPQGTYNAEWWNTRTGTVDRSETYEVGSDGQLGFTVQGLTTDTAVKFSSTAAKPTFTDVPFDHPFYSEIEALYQGGYTAGCNTNPLMYCPESTMNRAESAVFVERGIHGVDVFPSEPTEQIFMDVPLDVWAAKWATVLWEDGYTAGCGTDPLIYCPWQGHTRAEGAVFYLRMLHGADYFPPDPSGIFADVPLDAWYAKWVEKAYQDGILPACSQDPLKICPDDPLSRALAAYMMVEAKGLTLP